LGAQAGFASLDERLVIRPPWSWANDARRSNPAGRKQGLALVADRGMVGLVVAHSRQQESLLMSTATDRLAIGLAMAVVSPLAVVTGVAAARTAIRFRPTFADTARHARYSHSGQGEWIR